MKKKLFAAILIIIMLFSLTACNGSNIINMDSVLETPNSDYANFEVVENNYYGVVFVDKNTGVMYYWISANAGGITPLYNADGTLKLHEG